MTAAKPLPDHEARMAQARRRCLWELGDPTWADVVVAAYLNPAEDAANLREAMGPDDAR